MTNSYQGAKKEIALQMAEYFNERVTTSDLAEWLVEVLCDLNTDTEINLDDKRYCSGIISSISYSILIPLIKCNSKEEMKSVLKKGIVETFEGSEHEDNKAALKMVGKVILNRYAKYSDERMDAERFLKILGVFLSLSSIYENYDRHSTSELKKAA